MALKELQKARTIKQLLEWTPPKIDIIIHPLSSSIDDYLSTDEPTTTSMDSLLLIPAPSPLVLQKLVDALCDEEDDDKGTDPPKSIRCAHLTKTSMDVRLPVSIVNLWSLLMQMNEARSAWSKAKAHLIKLAESDEESDTVREDVLDSLVVAGWAGKLHGFSRNGATTMTAVAAYASVKWLKDDHINLALDLL
ncbi:hypothetical protein DFP72DRAFT_197292 [Ephemerocybe angulata]|uniref:Uncharacterized protein n=1 Tax=Ephemerocybe angulata TaxID=980116 RepID=A0A8H6H9Q9_9AGAR|nr:hypothetical protein DFP72DRAFT_197292 [Tulosesus angulatus]